MNITKIAEELSEYMDKARQHSTINIIITIYKGFWNTYEDYVADMKTLSINDDDKFVDFDFEKHTATFHIKPIILDKELFDYIRGLH